MEPEPRQLHRLLLGAVATPERVESAAETPYTALCMRTSVAALTAAGVITLACASQMPPAAPSAPAPSTPGPAARTDLTGTWSGTGSDSFSAERVTWVLAQSGSNVTGTAEFAPVDPRDGSCASCHKLRKG